MRKKILSVLLAATMVLTLAACANAEGTGNVASTSTATSTVESTSTPASVEPEVAEVVKPEKITVMWDGTIFKEGDNYAEDFYKALEEALGMEIEFVRPDHSTYSDHVGIAFNDQATLADVVILPAQLYASYAAQGSIWNMTDAWLNSDTYNSGRLIPAAETIMSGWYVTGADGEKGIYGMYPARGNGCVTYVNKQIANKAGYTDANLPKTWAEYQDFLLALREATGSAPVLAAGGMFNNEAPFTNYLPEFYQGAYIDFYYDEAKGAWVDGFDTPEMKAAMERLAWGFQNDVIDSQILEGPSTADVRNKFYESNSTSVFTYWAGTWDYTITTNLAKNGNEDGVYALAPIAELGAYYDRLSPMICITSACKNPEGVFKYFIDPMLDGGDVQMLWQYGVKDVHYEVKEDGSIVGLATEATKGSEKETITKKNLFEAQLKLAEYDTAKFPNGDPGYATTVTAEALESFQIFDAGCKAAPTINTTDVSLEFNSTLLTTKQEILAKVAKGELTPDEAIAKYEAEAGATAQAILDSFNE